ncbi:MAG: quinoprotein dehydrogenase-associated SoxYZ-like carrier [Nevskia sp.]
MGKLIEGSRCGRAFTALVLGGAAAGFALFAAPTQADLQSAAASGAVQASPVAIWPKLRTSLFGLRAIDENADAVIRLEAPKRAEDASTVPIAIRTGLMQTPERYIRKLYLLVDNNPSPVAAVFEFTPDSGRADIETRIRIEQYTDVRAVAEMNDGTLYMATHFVKASGGCSAPAGKDPEEAAKNLGRVKFRVEEPGSASQPAIAQLAISHPNSSGLVLDQVTRLYQPAYYVRRVSVSYAGKPVLTAEVDFSISENPNFRFYFLPAAGGELKAEIVDTRDLKFESEVVIKTRGS